MIHSFEVILILIVSVIALEVLARRMVLPSPFLLLPAGILIGFTPGFPQITLDPELVLYVFLPLLVYAGSALGSWVEFRKNLRPITLLSVGCVLFTTGLLAITAHTFIPGFGWAESFVLGAIISPPDEVAAISIARRLGIPKAMSTILEGEGLVNDATALTVFRFAAAAVVTHAFSPMKAAGSFALVIVGEISWGLIVAWTLLRLRRSIRDTSLETSLSLLTPFLAYLPAARLGGSGVLATVTAGLYISNMNSHWVTATTRLQVIPLWQIIEFVLDGILFLVAGMQLHHILLPLGRIENQYRDRLGQFREHLAGDHDGAVQGGTYRFNLQAELINTERQRMLTLRQSGAIDDAILRRIEKDLDLQEMRLRQGISEHHLYADERHES